jgi:uncharacterized protein YciI
MKHFIIEVTYTGTPEQIAATVTEHRAYLQKGYDKGWLLFSGPRSPRTGGMVVARAPSLEDLQEFFRTDPYQINHFATYEMIEFDPVKQQPFMENWILGKPVE